LFATCQQANYITTTLGHINSRFKV